MARAKHRRHAVAGPVAPFMACRIITAMRRWLLALMIVMLPIRGWMSDVMAVQGIPLPETTVEVIADGGQSALESSHFDTRSVPLDVSTTPWHCADHVPAAGHTAPESAALAPLPASYESNHPGGACNACQVCHSLAMSGELPVLTAGPLPAPPPVSGVATFTSAVLAPGLKPPIS